MKKRTAIISMSLALSLLVTGCSLPWSKGTHDSNSTAEDYKVEDCITIGDYKGIEVDVSVSEDEVQSEIDSLISQKTTTKKIKRKVAKKGDIANIDFVGKVDGKKFDGGSAEKQDLTLGSGSFIDIDGFEDGVVGMKVGEKKTLNLKFPDPYTTNTELSGKAVKFTVTLNSLSEQSKPKLTDKFIKANTDYKTIEEYKKAKSDELKKSKEESKGGSAFSTILEKAEVKSYPEVLITKYKTYYDTYWKAYLSSQGMDFDTFLTQSGTTQEQYDEQVKTTAENLAKNFLVIRAIAEKEGLTVTDEEKETQKKELLTQTGSESDEDLAEKVKSYYGLDLDTFLTDGIYETKVVDLIAENVVLKE